MIPLAIALTGVPAAVAAPDSHLELTEDGLKRVQTGPQPSRVERLRRHRRLHRTGNGLIAGGYALAVGSFFPIGIGLWSQQPGITALGVGMATVGTGAALTGGILGPFHAARHSRLSRPDRPATLGWFAVGYTVVGAVGGTVGGFAIQDETVWVPITVALTAPLVSGILGAVEMQIGRQDVSVGVFPAANGLQVAGRF
jgi:hypothetical protein